MSLDDKHCLYVFGMASSPGSNEWLAIRTRRNGWLDRLLREKWQRRNYVSVTFFLPVIIALVRLVREYGLVTIAAVT